jgi:hypothetical protein
VPALRYRVRERAVRADRRQHQSQDRERDDNRNSRGNLVCGRTRYLSLVQSHRLPHPSSSTCMPDGAVALLA